jgi:hypothetical protein
MAAYTNETDHQRTRTLLLYQLEEVIKIHQRIAQTLAEFYRAPLSMASVQPLLDLAVELNPELKEKK